MLVGLRPGTGRWTVGGGHCTLELLSLVHRTALPSALWPGTEPLLRRFHTESHPSRCAPLSPEAYLAICFFFSIQSTHASYRFSCCPSVRMVRRAQASRLFTVLHPCPLLILLRAVSIQQLATWQRVVSTGRALEMQRGDATIDRPHLSNNSSGPRSAVLSPLWAREAVTSLTRWTMYTFVGDRLVLSGVDRAHSRAKTKRRSPSRSRTIVHLSRRQDAS